MPGEEQGRAGQGMNKFYRMSFDLFREKMEKAGLNSAAIDAFRNSFETLRAGQSGMIPESSIRPVAELPTLESIDDKAAGDPALLSQTLIVKLNGGLGTSMGLERAKSLLVVKEGLTFLDFIARQVLYLRKKYGEGLRFMLMNSFSTSQDSLAFLRKYADLGNPGQLELMQSQVPKVDAKTLAPASWPQNSQLEWCPPGHGDIYPSLLGSGKLERLLADGVKYMFVSNSDNLGASIDLKLLNYFARSGKPFLMEVAERTASDRKGGHLAERGGKLLLRESAQCPDADTGAFQDIQRHRFFNTNSLWIRLDALRELLARSGGFVPLPLIKNSKTLDPRDKNSPPVFQLETAMGAAIESFEGAGAIVVPRSRFAPVKTTADLLALRSDAYAITEDFRLVLANGPKAQPPTIDLDSTHYKLVDQLEEKIAGGVPSLRSCRELKVRGPVRFRNDNVFNGTVTLINKGSQLRELPPGHYINRTITLNN
jgi:UDP-N-acetylglucosamine pyrophosphorylase